MYLDTLIKKAYLENINISSKKIESKVSIKFMKKIIDSFKKRQYPKITDEDLSSDSAFQRRINLSNEIHKHNMRAIDLKFYGHVLAFWVVIGLAIYLI